MAACLSPFHVDVPGRLESVPVPCGRCPHCLQRRVAEWSFRLRKQDEVSGSSFFVTLTYDSHHVPMSPRGFMTLDSHLRGGKKPSELSKKRDLQLFFKLLRKKTGFDWKYYAVGEYGTLNWRPHYHVILFCNAIMDKNQVLKYLYESWDKGGIDVGQVTGASVAYTLKYVQKPKRVPQHKNDDRLPEFSIMSKNLGAHFLTPAVIRYYQSNLDSNYLVLDGYKLAMPRYYRDKILDSSLKLQQRKIIRNNVAEKLYVDMERYFDMYPNATDSDYYTSRSEIRKMLFHNFFHKQSIRKL